jgi:hypothetical protein
VHVICVCAQRGRHYFPRLTDGADCQTASMLPSITPAHRITTYH